MNELPPTAAEAVDAPAQPALALEANAVNAATETVPAAAEAPEADTAALIRAALKLLAPKK